MATLFFVGFILFLYVPHLLFRFAAATKFDFYLRKDVPQIEEFFAGTLPSACLNIITFVELNIFYRLTERVWFTLDRQALAVLIAPAAATDLSTYVKQWNMGPTMLYLAVLVANCLWIGRSYGITETLIARYDGLGNYVFNRIDQAKEASQSKAPLRKQLSALWRTLLAVRRALRVRFWRLFYYDLRHPLYPNVLRNAWVFVLTKQGLFHGQIFSYDKERNGDILGIYLVNASRFSRQRDTDCINEGKNPVSDLTGPIFLKWDEVSDINFPHGPEVLQAKRDYYDQRIRERAST